MAARTQKSESIWDRTIHITRAEGLRGLLKRAEEYSKTRFRLARCYLLYVNIDPQAPLPQARGSVTVEQVLPGDRDTIAEIVQIYRVPADAEGILKRMANNELCYAARVDGRVIGYVWIYVGDTVKEYNESLFTLAPDEVYYHDAYVTPQMRGRSIYTLMKAITARELAERLGKKRAVSFIRWDNHASMNASRKLGAVRIGRIGYVMLFGKRYRYLIRERPRPL